MTGLLGPNAVRAACESWLPLHRGSVVLRKRRGQSQSGELLRIPLRYDADLYYPSWNQKNEVVTGSLLMRSSIWRFRTVPN